MGFYIGGGILYFVLLLTLAFVFGVVDVRADGAADADVTVLTPSPVPSLGNP